jgi:hypothetical protein
MAMICAKVRLFTYSYLYCRVMAYYYLHTINRRFAVCRTCFHTHSRAGKGLVLEHMRE